MKRLRAGKKKEKSKANITKELATVISRFDPAPADNEATMPADEATMPDNEAITPADEATTPANKATTPANKATVQANEATTPLQPRVPFESNPLSVLPTEIPAPPLTFPMLCTPGMEQLAHIDNPANGFFT